MSAPASGGTGGRWLPAGTTLNDTYALDKGLAAGGMGEVYRAHNIRTGSVYAIKMIRTELTDYDGAMSMFLREATGLEGLFHEAIVRYFGFSVDPTLNRPYMVMEYVSGRSLSEIIKVGPMSYEAVRTLGIRLAGGLQTAHDNGIIHRDISPDNILVPNDDVGLAKIIDFGIARQLQSSEHTIIGQGGFAGKYNYVSPEQLGMFGEVAAASDIYSLGLVLAEASAGRAINMRGNQAEVVEKRKVAPDLRHIDGRLQPVIAAMLQPDPRHRPRSMTEVVSLLRRSGTAPPTVPPVGDDLHELTSIQAVQPLWGRTPPPDALWQHDGGPQRAEREPSGPPGQRGTPMPQVSLFRPQSPSQLPRGGSTPPMPGAPQAGHDDQAPRQQKAVASRLHPALQGKLSSRQPGAPEQTFGPSRPAATAAPAVPVAAETRRAGGGGVIVAVVALVVVVVVGGAGGGFWYWQQQRAAGPGSQQTGISIQPGQTQPLQQQATRPAQPDAPPKPAVRLGDLRAVDMIRFLADYQGGPCFFVNPIVVADNQVVTEGYGRSIVPFEHLDADFRLKAGFEADIRLRQVTEPQCPVVDFLGKTHIDGPSKTRIEVLNSTVKVGDPIVGEASAPAGFQVAVLLVADDGSAKVLARSERPDGAPVQFDAPAERFTDGDGKPGLVVAITSPQPLQSLAVVGPQPAATLIEAVKREAQGRGDRLASAAQYLAVLR
ncbi:MAG: protein kinase [Ancalomicrobiaceae bacterium]|nr:protein kinase [Ancalomicrobiaceae bacterium]